MGRTLADDIADDFNRVFLNTDHFAVEVAYTPKGGSVRTIRAQVCGINGGIHHESHHLTNERMILVAVMRDVTDGVDDPQIGDKIVWEGTTYNFDAVSGESSSEFMLRFKAIDRNRSGNLSAMK